MDMCLDHQTASSVRTLHRFRRRKRSCRLRRQSRPTPFSATAWKAKAKIGPTHFLDEFQKRRGYDLRPLLPALVTDFGPKTLDIRHDWGKTLYGTFQRLFHQAMRRFAQTHGNAIPHPGVWHPLRRDSTATLLPTFPKAKDSNGMTTGPRDTRVRHVICWASRFVHRKRSHGFIRQPFRATPLDIKAEADLHFLQGVNQIICHGWPYTARRRGFSRLELLCRRRLRRSESLVIVMPDVTRYLQESASSSARERPPTISRFICPTAMPWANFSPGRVSLSDEVGRLLGNQIVGKILDAGYNLDFFDDGMLDIHGHVEGGALVFGENRYRIIVLAGVERIPLSTMRKLEDFAAARRFADRHAPVAVNRAGLPGDG